MENKILILDYAKWRCGDFGEHMVGLGNTLLENNEGYQCCLGQFAPQLYGEEIYLNGSGRPNQTEKIIPLLTESSNIGAYVYTTELASEAISINDNPATTPKEKIKLLKELFGEQGYKIQVINKPEDVIV